MSALLAPAKPHRIKATHRRRRKVASGRFVQRYYDAEIARFLTPDPVGPEEDFVNHFNRYNYAQNNPVRYTDPDGRLSRDTGPLKSCRDTNSCKTNAQADAGVKKDARELVGTVVATAVAGGAAAVAVTTGAAATVATAVESADVAVGIQVNRAITVGAEVVKSEVALVGNALNASSTTIASATTAVDIAATTLASPSGATEFVSGLADGLSGVKSPSTSTTNAIGGAIGEAINSFFDDDK